MRAERGGAFYLALAGLASASLYALLALRYPLVHGLRNPRANWLFLTTPTWASLAFHVGIYLGLTVLYALALRLLTASSRSPRQSSAASSRTHYLIIVLTWLLCCGILMTAAPNGESRDIFDYTFRGRMMAELEANPLVEVPNQYSDAPFFRYVGWKRYVDTYGPVWEMASAATAAITRETLKAADLWVDGGGACPQSSLACRNLVGYVLAYRLLAVGLVGLSAWLVVDMVRRNRRQLAAAALVAWLWSPLLLVSTAVGAHNDALMIVLLLLMLWLLQRRRWFLALMALVLAAHVKLTALVVAPVVGLWLLRRCGWRRAIGLGLAALGTGLLLSWLLYAPFGGWSSLAPMLKERSAFLANSPWRIVYVYLTDQRAWSGENARQLTVQLSSALFVASSVLASLWMLDFRPRRWKSAPAPDWRDDRLLWRAVAAVVLLYLLIGSFWFQHWYVVWLLVPAVLLPDSLLTRWLLPWLGFGALSANVVEAFAVALAPGPVSKVALAALVVAVIWTPMAIAGGWLLARWLAQRNGASVA